MDDGILVTTEEQRREKSRLRSERWRKRAEAFAEAKSAKVFSVRNQHMALLPAVAFMPQRVK
jgi:hypothetical protein